MTIIIDGVEGIESEEKEINVEAVISGNGATIANVFQFTGTVRVISQEAEISEITDITTCTNVHATIYDGTNSIDLTADGISLSGLPIGSWFTKDKTNGEIYSLNSATQVRLNEVAASGDAGLPFQITGKTAVTNYIRFHFTGDANTNFKMKIKFKYTLFNGATLALA